MAKIKEITFAGRQVKLASPRFSEEVCDLIELLDKAGKHHKAQLAKPETERLPFDGDARATVLLWRVAKDSMVHGGHTEDEAKDILAGISLDDDEDTGLPVLMAALGVR